MGGEVVTVRRDETRPLGERSALLSVLGSARVLFRHLRINLSRSFRGRDPALTVAYPEESLERSGRFRGVPVLVAGEDGASRCVPCGRCVSVCPSQCLVVWPARPGSAPGPPERFDLDMSRCVFCGLCESVCPEQAIAMSSEVAIADYERSSLRYELADLLVSPELLEGRRP